MAGHAGLTAETGCRFRGQLGPVTGFFIVRLSFSYISAMTTTQKSQPSPKCALVARMAVR